MARCRTAALGGHVEPCDHGGHQAIAANSCRHRHGPQGQSLATAQWVEKRRGARVPVASCPVVLTLPDALAPLALHHPRVVYNRLCQAAAQPVRRRAAAPQPRGARMGLLAIRHTWGPPLLHHPHRHGVVPGGGFSPDGQRWIAGRPGCLLPVCVWSRWCRRLFWAGVQQLGEQGRCPFHGQRQPCADPPACAHLLARGRRSAWVVAAHPPCGGPAQGLESLGRSTHTAALAQQR